MPRVWGAEPHWPQCGLGSGAKPRRTTFAKQRCSEYTFYYIRSDNRWTHMAYAILRTAKLKSLGEIGGSLAHTFRERETPNANQDLAHQNEHHGAQSAAEVLKAIRGALPEKRRSDAVLCIEYFVGRSPEWEGDDRAYFDLARKWLVDRHGAENVISTHVHRDEKTPHLVAYVVPRDGDKLNAKKWLGGKKALSEMQTHFWQAVGRPVGLERGIEGSVARHTTVKEFYAGLERVEDLQRLQDLDYPKEREVKEKTFLTTTHESDHELSDRVAGAVVTQLLPALKEGRMAATREREQAREAGRLRKALEASEQRRRGLESYFDGLSPSQTQTLLQGLARTAARMRAMAKEVVGWFRGFVHDDQGQMRVKLQERTTGEVLEVGSPEAVNALRLARPSAGDLVRLSLDRAEVIERGNDRGRDRSPTR